MHRRPSEGWSSSRAPRKLPFRQGERGPPLILLNSPNTWESLVQMQSEYKALNRFHPLDLNANPFAAFSSPGTCLNSLLLQYIYTLNFMKWYKEMFTLLAELCQVLWNPKHNGCTDPGNQKFSLHCNLHTCSVHWICVAQFQIQNDLSGLKMDKGIK